MNGTHVNSSPICSNTHSGDPSDDSNDSDCVLTGSDVELSESGSAESVVVCYSNSSKFQKYPNNVPQWVQAKYQRKKDQQCRRRHDNDQAEIDELLESQQKDLEELKNVKVKLHIAQHYQQEMDRIIIDQRQKLHLLQESNKALEERNQVLERFLNDVICGACLQRLRTVAFRGCNHMWLCAHCWQIEQSSRGTRCPICRNNGGGVNHIIFS